MQITDLQYDLLELRDAHAKLRTTNEKLRRDQSKGDSADVRSVSVSFYSRLFDRFDQMLSHLSSVKLNI